MQMNFCRRCGTPLENLERHVYRCTNQHLLFANSSPTVGIWLVNEHNEVLVATRGIEPHKGMYDTIGGFVDENESLEEAMYRELEEELGITSGVALHYLGSGYDIYPYKHEDIPLLNAFFWARVPNNLSYRVSDDVANARFLPMNDIPLEQLSQDSIRASLQLLKKALAATDSK